MHCFSLRWFPDCATRHYLHGPISVFTPSAGGDLPESGAARGEERCLPGEESLGGEGLVKVARGVEHHFDNTFTVKLRMPVCWFQGSDVHAQVPGDGTADLGGIEHFAFDFAALPYVFSTSSVRVP